LIVGGGDSAVEAAVALARQKGNTVTVSYRRDAFVRLREKNEASLQEYKTSGAVKVLFNSEVNEILPREVIVRQNENVVHKLRNDYVFIFAGGELPGEFLKKVGIRMRSSEMPLKAA
jgi:thioredoxin reductase